MRRSAVVFGRTGLGVALLGLVLAALGPRALAEPDGPKGRDHEIAVTVAELLERRHLSRHPLDAEIAHRTVTQFLKMLDPMKVYFLDADVRGFLAREKEVEGIKRGDINLAYSIYRVFMKRLDTRLKLAEEMLTAPHDFTVDEDMIFDPDATEYAKDEAEAREKWRKRVKYDLLDLKAERLEEARAAEKTKKDAAAGKTKKAAAGEESKAEEEPALTPAEQQQADVQRLRDRYRSVATRWRQVDNDELLELYLSAVSMSFDPHTSYMSPTSVDNFAIQMKLKLEGIGAALQWKDGYTVVEQIVPGGAADKDGRLKTGDKVIGVGQGKTGSIEDVVAMKLTDVVRKIRGPKGTVVRLQVVPKGGHERKIIDITRAEIQLKDREARAAIFEEGRNPAGKPYRIGVIDLDSFYMDMEGARRGDPNFKSTTRDVRGILEKFNREKVDAVVIDLRRNGGGSLQEAIDLTGLFIGMNPVVQVKGPDGRTQHYNEEKEGIVWKGPLVVLISKYSASASEIFAGAVQDYRRGLIVGGHSTHGKGTVQSLLDLSEELYRNPFTSKLGALKLTIQSYYRPNGDSTQLRGVLSDVEIPSMTSHRDVGEADLDYPTAFDRVKPVKFTPFDFVTKPLTEELSRLSAQRRASSDDFKRLLKRIARYEEKKKLKRVTLNEKKFLDEWAEINAQREEEKELEEPSDASKAEIKRDFYLNEALAITADYVSRWPGNRASQAAQTLGEE